MSSESQNQALVESFFKRGSSSFAMMGVSAVSFAGYAGNREPLAIHTFDQITSQSPPSPQKDSRLSQQIGQRRDHIFEITTRESSAHQGSSPILDLARAALSLRGVEVMLQPRTVICEIGWMKGGSAPGKAQGDTRNHTNSPCVTEGVERSLSTVCVLRRLQQGADKSDNLDGMKHSLLTPVDLVSVFFFGLFPLLRSS